MKLFSKKGQISTEMSLLIFTALLGTMVVGYELLNSDISDSLKTNGIKNTTMKGFAN
jgi:uncharacterized protein (UPF0333 family)